MPLRSRPAPQGASPHERGASSSAALVTTRAAGLSGVVVLAWLSGSAPAAQEVHLTSGEFEQLDTFEGHRLTKADKFFNKKDYRRAAAEYDTFMKEFPKSKALPYAILRMGRSLEYGNKRYQAVKVYNDMATFGSAGVSEESE